MGLDALPLHVHISGYLAICVIASSGCKHPTYPQSIGQLTFKSMGQQAMATTAFGTLNLHGKDPRSRLGGDA